MNDDYLWDRSGEPDPEVARLEELLAPLRHAGRAPLPPRRLPPPRRRPARLLVLAAAAALMVVADAALLPRGHGGAAWEIAGVEGTPRVGAARLVGRGHLPVGAWLETDARSSARLSAAETGEIEVEPNTRLRLVRTREPEQRLELRLGTLHARIWAPPGRFLVETPSALAVDLGCAYTLTVERSGAARVRVSSGWVGFTSGGRESFIPAGAACDTRPGAGPGTPWREDAPEALKSALARLDFDATPGGDLDRALTTVLASAHAEDAFTLWHLLTRLEGEARGQVFERMAALAPPPAGVTRAGVLGGDRAMLDRWWSELGLGDVELWRTWERPWPRPS